MELSTIKVGRYDRQSGSSQWNHEVGVEKL